MKSPGNIFSKAACKVLHQDYLRSTKMQTDATKDCTEKNITKLVLLLPSILEVCSPGVSRNTLDYYESLNIQELSQPANTSPQEVHIISCDTMHRRMKKHIIAVSHSQHETPSLHLIINWSFCVSKSCLKACMSSQSLIK